MILDTWKEGAEALTSQLPTDSYAAMRTGYLLERVSTRAVEVSASVFDRESTSAISADRFLVIDRAALAQSRTQLGKMALNLPGVAFVAHGHDMPSVLALPKYDATKPLGNASVFLHELEHITEQEAALTTVSVGQKERRAYQTNADILIALDGSDFQAYVENWPVDFTHAKTFIGSYGVGNSVDVSFRDTACPRPPKGTFAYDMWREDGASRQMLQGIGRATIFEKLTANLNEPLINKLADGLHGSNGV